MLQYCNEGNHTLTHVLYVAECVGWMADRQVYYTQPAGEVFCYAGGEKPPVGQGLNCAAEITLLGVYKTDKETGQPVRDGSSLAK